MINEDNAISKSQYQVKINLKGRSLMNITRNQTIDLNKESFVDATNTVKRS